MAKALKKDQETTAPGAEHVVTDEIICDNYPADVANAEAMAVRSRTGSTFWRSGCQFDADFVVINRVDVADNRAWMRIATDPQLEVREVRLQAAGVDADVPQ